MFFAAPQSTKPQKLDIIEPATSKSAAAATNIEVSTEKSWKVPSFIKTFLQFDRTVNLFNWNWKGQKVFSLSKKHFIKSSV